MAEQTAPSPRFVTGSTLRHVVVVCLAWALLFAGQSWVVAVFSARGVTADLVRLFRGWTAGGFLFIGAYAGPGRSVALPGSSGNAALAALQSRPEAR